MAPALHLKELLTYDRAAPMLFTGGEFLFWFSLVYLGFLALRERRGSRILYLTLASWFFYYKCSGAFLLALLFTTGADFLIAQRIHKTESERGRRLLLSLSILLSGGILVYFKYTNFFMGSIARMLTGRFDPLDIVLPAGISFYTFESVSYVVDVYRRRVAPTRHFFEYACYLAYFPHILAGPILRAGDLLEQIRARPVLDSSRVGSGLFMILLGLVKKSLIADYLARLSDSVFAGGAGLSGFELLLGVYGYAFQIYCDFSGYSDMAVGLGRLTGIELPENFRSPYAAGSVTEFWRRWHMTLSAWLRDYIYIPLGGNRRGRLHTCLNLLATMAFGGLWHGAKMTFVLWGLMHGLLLCIEKATEGLRERMRARAFGRVIMTLVTFQLVTLLWVLFRAASLRLSAALLLRIATDFQLETVLPVLRARVFFLVVLLVGAVLSVTPREHIDAWSRRFSEAPLWVKAATMLAVVQGALELRRADLQPFIYFQF